MKEKIMKFAKSILTKKAFWVTVIIAVLLLIIRIQCSCNNHSKKIINKYKETKIEKKY